MKNLYKSEVLDLIKKKLNHFRSFRRAATARPEKKQLRQFKTEKWLQAELIHYFWSKNIRAIPEYSKQLWDLYVDDRVLLALKCLADSGQSARADYFGGSSRDSGKSGGVEKDLNDIARASVGKSAFAMILPLDPNDTKRKIYRDAMMSCIDKHPRRKNLTVDQIEFQFSNRATEGIVVVWIERR